MRNKRILFNSLKIMRFDDDVGFGIHSRKPE